MLVLAQERLFLLALIKKYSGKDTSAVTIYFTAFIAFIAIFAQMDVKPLTTNKYQSQCTSALLVEVVSWPQLGEKVENIM